VEHSKKGIENRFITKPPRAKGEGGTTSEAASWPCGKKEEKAPRKNFVRRWGLDKGEDSDIWGKDHYPKGSGRKGAQNPNWGKGGRTPCKGENKISEKTTHPEKYRKKTSSSEKSSQGSIREGGKVQRQTWGGESDSVETDRCLSNPGRCGKKRGRRQNKPPRRRKGSRRREKEQNKSPQKPGRTEQTRGGERGYVHGARCCEK